MLASSIISSTTLHNVHFLLNTNVHLHFGKQTENEITNSNQVAERSPASSRVPPGLIDSTLQLLSFNNKKNFDKNLD